MARYHAKTEIAVPDSPPGLAVSDEGRNPSLLERVLPFILFRRTLWSSPPEALLSLQNPQLPN